MSNQSKRSDVFYIKQIMAFCTQNVTHMRNYMPFKTGYFYYYKSTGILKNWMYTLLLGILMLPTGIFAQGHLAPSPEIEQKVRETLKKNAETIRFMENKGQLGDSKVLYYFESRQGAVSVEKDRIR